MWDENDAADGLPESEPAKEPKEYVDLNSLDDGRCKASSYRVARMPERTTYENLFGVGGYNRCMGASGHANPLHKDEWGHVFRVDEDGANFKVVRQEPFNPNPPQVML